jgi:hypothetical protein
MKGQRGGWAFCGRKHGGALQVSRANGTVWYNYSKKRARPDSVRLEIAHPMGHHDINLEAMREAVLKLEVTQFARTEVQLAKTELRDYLQSEVTVQATQARQRNGKVVRYIVVAASILIGSDIWAYIQPQTESRECSSGGSRK